MSSSSKTFAWLQLLRLPNVFTAVADVTMGFLVTPTGFEPKQNFALLVVASSLLYLSGMVLNDVFDAEIDADERPERPIPSGRVSLECGRRRRLDAACWWHRRGVVCQFLASMTGGRASSPRCSPRVSCFTTAD